MISRVSDKNFGLFILGESLIAISLGSSYWIRLVRYSDLLFFGTILLSTYYINKTLIGQRSNAGGSPRLQALGLLVGFLLFLLFGMQAPQLPLKRYILTAGLILIIPALKDLISGQITAPRL